MGHPSAPHFPSGPSALLLGLLTLLGDLGGRASAFGLGLLLGGVALGICLVLLGLALAVEIIATGHGARDLLGLALNALDDALDGLFGTVVVSHCAIPPSESKSYGGDSRSGCPLNANRSSVVQVTAVAGGATRRRRRRHPLRVWQGCVAPVRLSIHRAARLAGRFASRCGPSR